MQVVLVPRASRTDVEPAIQDIVYGELADLPSCIARLARDALPIC